MWLKSDWERDWEYEWKDDWEDDWENDWEYDWEYDWEGYCVAKSEISLISLPLEIHLNLFRSL